MKISCGLAHDRSALTASASDAAKSISDVGSTHLVTITSTKLCKYIETGDNIVFFLDLPALAILRALDCKERSSQSAVMLSGELLLVALLKFSSTTGDIAGVGGGGSLKSLSIPPSSC